MKDYNFACGSVWVRNMVYDINGGTFTEGDICTIFSRRGKKRYAYRLSVGKPDGKTHLEDQDVGG
jgi:hypothetical protein